MTSVRSLPTRVPPIAGEAIDSWLEALAARTSTTWNDLLIALGLYTPRRRMRITTPWIVGLPPQQSADLAEATGLDSAVLAAMTLSHYDDRVFQITTTTRTVVNSALWRRGTGSRYCPMCLAESGGRWPLAWRLGWTFACLKHRCLLVDTCPCCRAGPRVYPIPGCLTPTPNRCARQPPGAAAGTRQRCDADLTTAAVAHFPADHSVLHDQQIIDQVIATARGQFGVYQHDPQSSISVLADVRALAGRMMAYGTDSEIAALLPADIADIYVTERQAQTVQLRSPGPRSHPAPASAATAAVGVALALSCLDRDSITAAGDALRWLFRGSHARGVSVNPQTLTWGRHTTETLTAVQLAAAAPILKLSAQLRYRTASPTPTRPPAGATRAQRLIRNTPTMFWPEWSLRLAVPTIHRRLLPPSLAAITLLVGTRLTLNDARRQLMSPVSVAAASHALGAMGQQHWSAFSTAVTLLADHLADAEAPIDYQRRRRLDYSALLPDDEWQRIRRIAGTPGCGSEHARGKHVRLYLFERLSGLPDIAGPFTVDRQQRKSTAGVPRQLTPELSTALDQHCREFLAANNIDDEPPVWQPPLSILDDLALPAPGLHTVDIDELHRLIGVEKHRIGVAAQLLGTTWDTVHYLLVTNPCPAQPTHICGRRRYGTSYRCAQSALTPQRFRQLYDNEGLPLSHIAHDIGVEPAVLIRLADDYGIRLRTAANPAVVVDRDWLYAQYVYQRRSLDDLAREKGISKPQMQAWLTRYDIPRRPVGAPPHRADAELLARAPSILRPALVGRGGWDRLCRFAASSTYPSLTEAQKHLGAGHAVIPHQLARLERELATTLLARNRRAHPMELTTDGARVVAAVKRCQKKGFPTA